MKKRFGVIIILVLAFCGLANSAYLTEHEANGTPLLCNINGLSGCNVVASSPYSHIFGVSLAQYGLLFYGALFVLAALELVVFDKALRRALQGLTFFGFVASLYFVFLQVFVINALCVYCMASAVLAFLVFIFSFIIEPVRRSVFDAPEEPPRLARELTMPPWPDHPSA